MNKIFWKYFIAFGLIIIFKNTNAQKIDSLLKEAEKLEFKLKEVDALNKYKEVLTIYGDNFKALIKASE
ncbi:MAG TPA: hypothetical protein PLY81_04510, partial [Chitinophagaceae bacterium]|nr:hypothetical protein [Chitinophagaceae bacterium]